ncbi:hypothetical protein SMI01S_11740 [Sphingobacterium mizutaii NBRC 14946 = DSM 11724]|uniref:Uncharacterized protein n=2 Tax=Sphingobacterium mizutaii TaxID=1010 RepID=A0AAJ4XEF2_9SPHI|nr:hypothetical protein [Sphingobacterium mizutaii]GEM67568.1 hypothetical protein SMI01S_11740 [Sphingobacterium mizutaii NBRC 14946 = DSM 11724]SDL14383.1 hypothetical protein SAMN05192578_1011508 [Sphingobacterium mizutaii]SNV52128.1 Uncharacterised protein [Sphingobacterium mizutaii]
MTVFEAKAKLERISEKPDWIEQSVKELNSLVVNNQNKFAYDFLIALVEKIELEEHKIMYSSKNKKLLLKLDKMMEDIKSKTFKKVLIKMISNVKHILNENIVYYGSITADKKFFKATADQINEIVFNRLGFDKNGKIVREGYMQGLFDSPEVGEKLKDFVRQGMASKSEFESFRKGLRTLIEGEPDRMGIFERFYRNYAYDTYSQVDALQSKLLSEELELKYFIYNGGIIKTSRSFCIRKNGQVFSTDEAKKWESEEDNNAKPPNYDPLIHRGGYGCRHSIDYISEEMAFALRPDLVI